MLYFKLYLLSVFVTAGLGLLIGRVYDQEAPEDLESDDWIAFAILSVLSPIGILFIFSYVLHKHSISLWRFLIKTRTFKRGE